jgi:hypothetical protein
MWLIGTFHVIRELAVAFWQSSCDDVCPSWNAKGGTKKHSLTDPELMCRHGI